MLLAAAGLVACHTQPPAPDPWRILDKANGEGPPDARVAPDAGPSPRAIPLTPAVRPPRDPQGDVSVFVDLPGDDARIGWDGTGLVWPEGTILWRVVTQPRGELAEAQGLEHTPDGPRVRLVRTARGERGELRWRLGDPTIDREQVARTMIWTLPPYRQLRPAPAELAMLELTRQLDCAACHRPHQPAADRVLQYPTTMVGPTDHLGAYTPRGLWTDTGPAPAHGIADPNVDAPGVDAACPEGPVHRVTNARRHLRLRCSLGQVATLTHPITADDDHARARCASRAALAPHLDPAARQALRAPLEACGVAVPREPAPDTDP